jgi:Xaa-Pro aminopeptidase
MIGTRIESLRKAIRNAGIDAMLVLIEENRRYLSGFLGEDHQFDESAGALIISQDQLILATDSRFEVQARMESPLYEVVVYRKGLAKLLPDLIQRLDIRKLGFESIRLSVKQYEGLCKEGIGLLERRIDPS